MELFDEMWLKFPLKLHGINENWFEQNTISIPNNHHAGCPRYSDSWIYKFYSCFVQNNDWEVREEKTKYLPTPCSAETPWHLRVAPSKLLSSLSNEGTWIIYLNKTHKLTRNGRLSKVSLTNSGTRYVYIFRYEVHKWLQFATAQGHNIVYQPLIFIIVLCIVRTLLYLLYLYKRESY